MPRDVERGRLAGFLATRRDDAVALLERLVAVDTQNPPGRGCHEMVTLLAAELQARGLRVEVVEIEDAPAEYPRFLVRAELGEGPDRAYFHGHYDVVPVNDPSQLAARVTTTRVHGRGTSDMKGGLVSMILAAEAIRAMEVDLGGKLVLHFVPDEETGGRYGASRLGALGFIDAAAELTPLPEPSSGVVWSAHRGALSMMVRVRGSTAHVGLPQRGANAVEAALPLLQAAIDLRRELGRKPTASALGTGGSDCGTLVIGGRVDGPTTANAVPDRFEFSLDCRYNPEEEPDEFQWHVEEMLEQAAADEVEYELDIFQAAAPSVSDPQAPGARALAAQIAAVTGEQARFELCPGVLETRFYRAAGVEALAYGPGILAVSHGPEELVLIDEVMRCAEIYAGTVTAACGAARC